MKVLLALLPALLMLGCASSDPDEPNIPPELTQSCVNKAVGEDCQFGRRGGNELSGKCIIVFEDKKVCYADPLPTIGESSQLLIACKGKDMGEECTLSEPQGNRVTGSCLLNKEGHLMCAEYSQPVP